MKISREETSDFCERAARAWISGNTKEIEKEYEEKFKDLKRWEHLAIQEHIQVLIARYKKEKSK